MRDYEIDNSMVELHIPPAILEPMKLRGQSHGGRTSRAVAAEAGASPHGSTG